MSSSSIPTRLVPPPQQRLETAEDSTAAFRKSHASKLESVEQKARLRRFVPPVHRQPSKREGRALTEADVDRFLASLDRKMFPAALLGNDAAISIGNDFWAARACAWTFVCRRLSAERKVDDLTMAAVERAIGRTLLVRDRTVLLNFVGVCGVDPMELALALWSSHATGWFALASDEEPLWPRVTAWLAAQGSRDGLERGANKFGRFSSDRARVGVAPAAAKGMRPYQALLGGKG